MPLAQRKTSRIKRAADVVAQSSIVLGRRVRGCCDQLDIYTYCFSGATIALDGKRSCQSYEGQIIDGNWCCEHIEYVSEPSGQCHFAYLPRDLPNGKLECAAGDSFSDNEICEKLRATRGARMHSFAVCRLRQVLLRLEVQQ